MNNMVNSIEIDVQSLTQLGTCVLTADDAGRVRWMSNTLVRLLGPDCVGKQVSDLTVSRDHDHSRLSFATSGGETLPVRGVWLTPIAGEGRIFVGAPLPLSQENLLRLGLRLDDFPDHDRWLDYLTLKDEAAAAHREAMQRERQLKDDRTQLTLARDEMAEARKATLNMLLDLEQSRIDAEAATRAKSCFLANMSHEIRTPMTSILGFTELLLDDLQDPVSVETAVTIKRNGEHLLTIINDILDLSKIEAGKFEAELIEWSPRQVTAEVVSLLHARATEKGLTLDVQHDGPLPETITTDPSRLRQILINLVGNSIKFTCTGGIRIVTRLLNHDMCEPKLQFDVIDTGVGIPQDQLATVFQEFSQADESVSRNFGGTGLGLAISRKLAQLLGGDVTAESELGEGSTFTLTISTGPLNGVRLIEYDSNSAITITDQDGLPRDESEQLPYRVLLVDDIPDNRLLISSILSSAGADVTVARNGQEAIDKALATCPECDGAVGAPTKPFDVILMDVQMPVVDGHEATRKLRRLRYTSPIIALTAHAMSEDRQKCIDAGCDDYVTKPVDRKKLLETVARWARRHAERPSAAEFTNPEINANSQNTRIVDTLATCPPA